MNHPRSTASWLAATLLAPLAACTVYRVTYAECREVIDRLSRVKGPPVSDEYAECSPRKVLNRFTSVPAAAQSGEPSGTEEQPAREAEGGDRSAPENVAVALPPKGAAWTRPTDPERVVMQASVALLDRTALTLVEDSWHVTPKGDMLPVRCGGALVGPRRVVTSRECLESFTAFTDIRVVVGHGVDAPPAWIEVDGARRLKLADRDVFTSIAAPRFGGPGDHWALFEIAGNGPEAEPLAVAQASVKPDGARGLAVAGSPAGRPLPATGVVSPGFGPEPADAALFFIVGRPQDIPGSPVVDVAGRKLVGVVVGGVRADGGIALKPPTSREPRVLAVQRLDAATFARALAPATKSRQRGKPRATPHKPKVQKP